VSGRTGDILDPLSDGSIRNISTCRSVLRRVEWGCFVDEMKEREIVGWYTGKEPRYLYRLSLFILLCLEHWAVHMVVSVGGHVPVCGSMAIETSDILYV
jgi:hypothetical protein